MLNMFWKQFIIIMIKKWRSMECFFSRFSLCQSLLVVGNRNCGIKSYLSQNSSNLDFKSSIKVIVFINMFPFFRLNDTILTVDKI